MNADENQIVAYQPDATIRLDVRLENETVWLTQEQMCALFQRERSVITKHVRNVFGEGECDETDNVQILHTNQRGRPLALYSLDVIISVGYRVKSPRGTQFRRWATRVLRNYLLHGHTLNQRMELLEDKMDRRLSKQEERIASLEEKVDFFVQTRTPPLQRVFYEGQLWDARALVARLIAGAKRSIALIDNWATAEVLDLFAKKRKGVKATIVTSEHFDRKQVPHRKITEGDVKAFNEQYPTLAVRHNESFHDRFLLVDDRELYLIGASLKDLGRKCFGFVRMDAGEIRRLKKAAFAGGEKTRT